LYHPQHQTELGCLSKYFISVLLCLPFSLTSFLPFYLSDRRPTKVTTSCCTSVSNTHIKFRLQGYHIQNGMPPCVDAIELKSFSSPDLEYLTIKLRPYYLPR
uniref:Chemokine interleukin-8-like domain-containing protein n=1 Tax=Salmo trutta TaxID=8032 RepID=A0A674D3R6_SALTR